MYEEKIATFEKHRRTLEGLSYRMLGTLSEAQNVVQETYLKWHKVDSTSLANPRAWLITVCSRIALNHLKSAKRVREVYVGEWLPEPYPEEFACDSLEPSIAMEFDDTISMALLLALEKLSPAERAVFLLHDMFELSFDEISSAIGKSSVNCRKLATRARTRVSEARPRFKATPKEHESLFNAFLAAARQADTEKLVSLLAEDVELYSDGGGKVEALPAVLKGGKDVAIFFSSVFSNYNQQGIIIRTRLKWFNGSIGVLIFENEQLRTALTVETDNECVARIYAVRNPSKLGGFL